MTVGAALLEPRHATCVYGHDVARAAFQEALKAGRLHHAWLLHGPAGIGKATLAFHLARVLLKGENLDSPAGRRISAGTHGDLLVIARAKDEKRGRLRSEITAADVRPVQDFLHHTATEGGWRVVIVDGAEFLNRFAANALLKILEEPPQNTVLFLTSAAPGALLPTIRSRCRLLALTPLLDVDMRRVLPDLTAEHMARAQGAPGRALFLATDKDGSIADLSRKILQGQRLNTDLLTQIERAVRDADGFALLCDLLGEGLADQARHAARQGEVFQAEVLARHFTECEALRRETEQMNLDKVQAIRQVVQILAGN
nr:DNA polymerase III subunit delta' [uncultured Neokomagataea sp.]